MIEYHTAWLDNCRLVKLLICLVFSCWSEAIVFVHLGEEVPDCLWTTIHQARYWNPEWEIYLLTDQQELRCDDAEVVCDVKKSKEHEEFLKNCQVEGGYWTYTTERFFVLYDFMVERGLTKVVHLESDTMLYVALEELMPYFAETKVAAPFQSSVGCIPCFVYIRDATSLKFLVEYILQAFAGNDMRTLANFYQEHGDEMTPLPTLMKEYLGPKHRSAYSRDNRTKLRFLSQNGDQFPGFIFDAAGLGIYLNGCDRRFSPEKGAGTIHSRCLFYPHLFQYSWEEGKPYLEYQGHKYRVVNLHFYSKMPELYASDPSFLFHRD